MSNIAILGHPTRGREVIQLLEMLGGENKYYAQGNCTEVLYFIYDNKGIQYLMKSDARTDLMKVFTLEEFESEFPYKVGDKVIVWIDGYRSIYNIQNMEWDSIANEIKYKIQDYWYNTMNLQPYKEETMDRKYNIEEYLKVWEETEKGLEVIVNDRFELKEDNGKFYIIKKQPQYPTTYLECCKVLQMPKDESYIDIDAPLSYNKLLTSFTQLLICRDAYWKMGLGKSWKPDWRNYEEQKYCIRTDKGKITLSEAVTGNKILAFPTKEMRDAFYENFKKLINECKELL